MSTRSNLNGHDTYYDGSTWKYKDTDEVCNKNNERACIKCGKHSTEEGHDHCISNLGNVINACCGHGTSKGYIQFDNGITIRGHFEVEKS